MAIQRAASVTDRGRVAGDILLHPVVLAALGLLILNDHVLKRTHPGLLTGKLSDVAGLVFFPVFLVAAWELVTRLCGRRNPAGRRVVLGAVALTGVAFAIVKTQPAAADAFGLALGLAQWLIAMPAHVGLGEPVTAVVGARVIADATDLLALPALAVAWWVAATSAGDEHIPRRTTGLATPEAGTR